MAVNVKAAVIAADPPVIASPNTSSLAMASKLLLADLVLEGTRVNSAALTTSSANGLILPVSQVRLLIAVIVLLISRDLLASADNVAIVSAATSPVMLVLRYASCVY